jgi:hypothetical protein
LILFFCVNCPEKKSNSGQSLISAYALFSLQCPVSSEASISGSTRTATFFGNACTSFAMSFAGLSANDVSAETNIGATGKTTNSTIITQADFKSSGEKKVNIEVTFQINTDAGYIDVIGNATASGTKPVGPGFRIKTTTISAINNSGVESALTGSIPKPERNVQRTYCLEIHEENGAHVFGWSKACNALSEAERGVYEFELKTLSTTNPGSKVGFILNNSSLRRMVISGKIGTVGSVLSF